MKRLLVLVFIFIIAAGCAQKKEAGKGLAEVNSKTITGQDFKEKLNTLPEWARGKFTSEEGKKQFLDEIIKEELLYQEALKTGLDKDKEFQNRVEEFKRMTLLSTLLRKEIEEKVTLDEKEIKDFYDKHMDTFKTGEEVRVKHILVDTEDEAEDILKRILKKEDFSALAKTFSKDHMSAENGGDLGFFSRGRMVPEFEKAAFSLKPGEVSEPVKTSFGYHIIKVLEKKEGKQRTFDEVKESVERRLKAEKQKSIFDSYISKLKDKAKKIKINEEALKTLALEQTPGAEKQMLNPHGQ